MQAPSVDASINAPVVSGGADVQGSLPSGSVDLLGESNALRRHSVGAGEGGIWRRCACGEVEEFWAAIMIIIRTRLLVVSREGRARAVR